MLMRTANSGSCAGAGGAVVHARPLASAIPTAAFGNIRANFTGTILIYVGRGVL